MSLKKIQIPRNRIQWIAIAASRKPSEQKQLETSPILLRISLKLALRFFLKNIIT